MPTTQQDPRITADDTEAHRRQVEEAAAFVDSKVERVPSVAVLPGPARRPLAERIEGRKRLSLGAVPHFPEGQTRAAGEVSAGDALAETLTAATLGETPVVVLGRAMRLYDGYTPRQIAFPVRVLVRAGVDTLFVANRAVGANPQFETGDLMLVTDHVNLTGANPLVGPNVDGWGPRFPDMSEPYDRDLRTRAGDAALEAGLNLRRGVYLAVTGPSPETRAERQMARTLGADAVGTSTVPEVLAARHMGARVLALSHVTGQRGGAAPDAGPPLERLVRVLEGTAARLSP
jgi:purine-nucleoside phosphorylase